MKTQVPSRLEQLRFRLTEACVYPLRDRWRRRSQQTQKAKITNQKEIRVVGMRRTGNHAVLTWIEHQLSGEFFHLNNVWAGRNPYRHKADNLLRYHPEHAEMSQTYRRQANGKLIERDCLLYSYEDWSLAQIVQPRFEQNRELYLGRAAECFDVLILRDPFNLFASRLKQNFVPTKTKGLSMVAMWLEYAKEFVGETQYLSQSPDQNSNRSLVCVNYNRWFEDVAYRLQLSEQLGVPFSDAGLAKVPHLGGGSSFDGTQLDGRSMDVTNRWQRFADDPAFRALFENELLWTYTQRIFGELPGTETLRG
ncbi:MAG: hypothetical protein AAFN12_16215 [Cyanobacteria bacterium J06560_2]